MHSMVERTKKYLELEQKWNDTLWVEKKAREEGDYGLQRIAGKVADCYSDVMSFLEIAKDQAKAEKELEKLPSACVIPE